MLQPQQQQAFQFGMQQPPQQQASQFGMQQPMVPLNDYVQAVTQVATAKAILQGDVDAAKRKAAELAAALDVEEREKKLAR